MVTLLFQLPRAFVASMPPRAPVDRDSKPGRPYPGLCWTAITGLLDSSNWPGGESSKSQDFAFHIIQVTCVTTAGTLTVCRHVHDYVVGTSRGTSVAVLLCQRGKTQPTSEMSKGPTNFGDEQRNFLLSYWVDRAYRTIYQCVSFILPKNVDILSFLEELMFWVLSSRVVGESSGYFGSCFLMSTKKKAQRIL